MLLNNFHLPVQWLTAPENGLILSMNIECSDNEPVPENGHVKSSHMPPEKPGIKAQNTAREITFSEQPNMPPKMGLLMTKYCTPKVALSSDAKFTRKVNLQLKLVSNLCCLFLRVIACYNITSDHTETLEFFKYLFFRHPMLHPYTIIGN